MERHGCGAPSGVHVRRLWRGGKEDMAGVPGMGSFVRRLAAGALLAGACAGAAVTPPARAAAFIESAQEVTLAALGAPGVDASGGAVALAVAFPPPAGPLAAWGSFSRLFFSHSPGAASVTVAVNGAPLTTVALDDSTAAGGVFEVRLPAADLRSDQPNVVEARFDLRGAGRFARLGPGTLVHYQLFVPPGEEPPSRLEAFPFPLVRGGRPAPLGLVLPSAPTDADLSAAFRLAAGVARRAGAGVVPEVVTAGAVGWLRSSGVPALLVGPLGRLPLSAAVLRAAGFSRAVGPDDGLLVAARSPWDGDTPLLLVSGGSDRAVARAAAALVQDGPPPAGQYAIVRQAPPPPSPAATIPVDPGAGGEASGPGVPAKSRWRGADFVGWGPGVHVLTMAVTASPAGGPAALRLHLAHGPLAPGSALAVQLDGATVATVPMAGPARDDAVQLPVPAAALRAGRNALTLVSLLSGDGAWARVAPGATLVPPAARPAGLLLADAAALLDDPGGVLVVPGARDDATLSAAALALAELGARSTAVPALQVAVGGEARPGAGSLVAVGAGGALRPLRSGLPAAGPGGLLALRPLTAASTHQALWIEGRGPDQLLAAAAALGQPDLRGGALAVSATGQVAAVSPGPLPGPAPAPLLAARALVVAAAAALGLVLGWQVARARG
jgi:Bacterial cellulose synthase subunit